MRRLFVVLMVLLSGIPCSAQGFVSIDRQKAFINKVLPSVVEIELTYKPGKLEDPGFPRKTGLLGVGVHKDLVVTSVVWFSSPVQKIRARIGRTGNWVSCTLKSKYENVGIVDISCPGLGVTVPGMSKKPPKPEKSIYSLELDGDQAVVMSGIIGANAPSFLKDMFFVRGLSTPGLPLFTREGFLAGLIVRSGEVPQERTGVCISVQGFLRKIKQKGQGIHRRKVPHKAR